MTVQELIEKLQEYPPTAEVVYRACSDYQGLDASDLTFQPGTKVLEPGDVVRHHNLIRAYRQYGGTWEYQNKTGTTLPLPTPIECVIFPGN